MWTEGCLSAGIVDTLSTVEQLSQWGEGSEAGTQTVTQNKHRHCVFVDYMHSRASEQQYTAQHCCMVRLDGHTDMTNSVITLNLFP